MKAALNITESLFFIAVLLILLFVFDSGARSQSIEPLPDTPSSVQEQTSPPAEIPKKYRWHFMTPIVKPKGFWTVGRWDSDHPLRTNREVLKSKSFIILESAMYLVALADVNENRNRRQNPPVPRHGELYVDTFVPAGMASLFHFIGDKYICRCVGVLAPAATIARDLYATDKAFYQ